MQHASRVDRLQGFTLTELMIAVTVVGILAAIALPTYQAQMRKSRRADAQAVLMDIAQREQQMLLDTRSYGGTVAAIGVSVPAAVQQFYTIQICQTAAGGCAPPGGTPPTFAAVATPIPGSIQASDYTLTIDNTGAKTPSNLW